MPKIGVTVYSLLISCPGDVEEEVGIIREVVENFNRMFGEINNIQIAVKHWSTDAYPQSGGKPQDLLNKQFVNDCDAALAVFWTRFGTPTDKYQSGTEEEIEEMIKSGKQVFLYFADKPITPSTIDMAQYEKVQAFRKKYKDRGIYWSYSDLNELNKLLLNHISKYFLNILTSTETNDAERPQLVVRGVYDNKPSESLHILRGRWLDSGLFVEEVKEIGNLYEKISGIVLPKMEVEEKKEPAISPNESIAKLAKQFSLAAKDLQMANKAPAVVSDKIKDCILNYSQHNNMELSDDFFYLANLKKSTLSFNINPFGSSAPSYDGTEDEISKHHLIVELYWKIVEYNEKTEFYAKLQNYFVIKCIVSNIGKSYDEDVDVQLKIPKGCICKTSQLPIPGYSFIEEFNDQSIADYIYKIRKAISIDEYSNYPAYKSLKSFGMPVGLLNKKTAEEKYSEEKRCYQSTIDEIFCYEFFETEEYDILAFNITYLKQNTNMAIPSLLYFKSEPKEIVYEIRSKHSPDVVSGKIEVQGG
ncbi:MAG TPA: hypothetical protein PK733_13830 [Clostridiales bacterium]|nr:hypothetical protein [Clostridiales bacterium]